MDNAIVILRPLLLEKGAWSYRVHVSSTMKWVWIEGDEFSVIENDTPAA